MTELRARCWLGPDPGSHTYQLTFHEYALTVHCGEMGRVGRRKFYVNEDDTGALTTVTTDVNRSRFQDTSYAAPGPRPQGRPATACSVRRWPDQGVTSEVTRPVPGKYALFDVDGTLIDSVENQRLIMGTWAAQYGLDPDEVYGVALRTRPMETFAAVEPDGAPVGVAVRIIQHLV